jgi:hypothetical protein
MGFGDIIWKILIFQFDFQEALFYEFAFRSTTQSLVNTRQNHKKSPPLLRGFLWAHLESNQAPTDYESVALTD